MIDRRALLRAGAAGFATTAAAAATVGAGAPAAVAASRADDRFDLSVPAVSYLREKPLHNETIMQSFAFDDANGRLFAIQLMEGGIQLPDEQAPVSGADRSARGDLCLTRLSRTGSRLGHMYLRGFGHGASMGVEPRGRTSYIWTEADANPETGYGTAVARFRYADGRVLDSHGPGVHKLYVVGGSTSNRPAVDMRHRRLLVQYLLGENDYRYRVLDLDRAKWGDTRGLYDLPRIGMADTETPQGLALLGDYVYQMTGTHYTDESGTNPPSKRGDTYLSAIHLPTTRVVQRNRTEAAATLDYREPEGLAIQLGASPPRLHIGFASGVAGARTYTLCYQKQS
ncbi:teichoic acid biosynthesis protein C [Streptomyces sp. NPDC050560]|uniref:phage baseplate protein n=1 Tax=Streptomyces sp. NPDC050560 TaxID=3365630 RepID=UPI0037890799